MPDICSVDALVATARLRKLFVAFKEHRTPYGMFCSWTFPLTEATMTFRPFRFERSAQLIFCAKLQTMTKALRMALNTCKKKEQKLIFNSSHWSWVEKHQLIPAHPQHKVIPQQRSHAVQFHDIFFLLRFLLVISVNIAKAKITMATQNTIKNEMNRRKSWTMPSFTASIYLLQSRCHRSIMSFHRSQINEANGEKNICIPIYIYFKSQSQNNVRQRRWVSVHRKWISMSEPLCAQNRHY